MSDSMNGRGGKNGGRPPHGGGNGARDKGAPRRFEGARHGGPKPFGDRKSGGAPVAGAPAADGERKLFRPRPPRDGADEPRRFGKSPKASSGQAERPRRSEDARGEKPFRARSDGERDAGERPRFAKPHADRPRRETPEDAPGAPVRIAKRLARAGIASRRDAEGMIADGRVRLNGQLVATPAITVTASDRIEIDGKALPATERTRLWLFHKPTGLVTTNRDPEGRPTVFDRLPADLPRVLTVGRLDINTEGLLLLTNDGGLARALELPATGWLRRYRVRAHGAIKQAQLDELQHGIAIDGVFYGAIEATLDSEKGANVWMTLALREGKNREVKRILAHLGLEVNRLIRLSFGPFQLGELPEGAVREIRGRTLRDQLGERLIEESGADFDAPIVNPFTNAVVEGDVKPREPAAETAEARQRDTPAPRDEWVTAKGDGKSAGKPARPSRKDFGMAKRESALARLDTRPDREKPHRDGPRRDAPQRGGPKRPERDAAANPDDKPARPKSGTRRQVNVWMAPGAKPLGERRAAERAERDARSEGGGGERQEGRGDARPFKSRGFRDAPGGAPAKPGDKPRRSAGFRDRPDRPVSERPRGGDKGGDRPRGRG